MIRRATDLSLPVHAWRVPAALLWVVVLALLTAPMAVVPLAAGLGGSWVIALHKAFHDGLVWGRQVIWTYGPYSVFQEPWYIYFDTWLGSLVARTVVNVGYLLV